MKRLAAVLLLLSAATTHAQIVYPVTRKVDTVDDYHGTKVPDPYRWLEEDNSADTKAWVKEQNAATFDYLSKIPYRDQVRKKLEQSWNYTRVSAPSKEGNYYYFTRNNGLQNQSVWYRTKELNGKEEVFLDPNKFSADGTVSLGAMSFSKDGKYLAYAIQRAGSDWVEAYVMNAETKKSVGDSLKWLKFTGFSWKGDEGFYYSRYPEPSAEDRLKGKNLYQAVYFHKVGTPQSSDVLVYEDREHPQRFANAGLTEDERYLLLYTREGSSGGTEIKVRDLITSGAFMTLVQGATAQNSVVDNIGDKFLVRTNDGASNFKVVLVDLKNPAKEAWKVVIPEGENALQGVGTAGGYMFTSYLKDASTKVYQYTYDGKLVREIQFPGIGSAGGFGGKKKEKDLYYTFSSYNYAPTIYHYDIASGKSSLYKKSDAKFNPEDYEVKQVFFTSKDGARVPMFLTYRKGLVLNGQNPALLYGYGGFRINETPSFSVSNLFFLDQGGIYVDVVLRGGSEYGENWHKAGMLENKQNVFNDFIGAAEWLIQNKYTNSAKLAMTGGSNGGLLVGAAMTQRPELFKVAVPQVGVMDMLRYH